MKCYIVFDDYYTRNTKAISHAIHIYKKLNEAICVCAWIFLRTIYILCGRVEINVCVRTHTEQSRKPIELTTQHQDISWFAV